MDDRPRRIWAAVGLSLAAAFLWALYYPLVLGARSGASPAATIVLPFLFGGIAYLLHAAHGGAARRAIALGARPISWGRTGLLVGMQLSILAGTYTLGPVDASLLSLIGDVVVTPLLVAAFWPSRAGRFGSAMFAIGLALSLAGGALTIGGGAAPEAVRGAGWAIVAVVPLCVAGYFLLSAHANERDPPTAVVTQSTLAAAGLSLLLAPLLPGGIGSLLAVPPRALLLLAATGVTAFWAGPFLYFRAMERAGVVIPPMLMTAIPVFTLLLSAFVLRLGLPWIAVAGIPVAVLGAVLTLRGESRAGGAATGSAGSSDGGAGPRPR